jgi:hypothetical protein
MAKKSLSGTTKLSEAAQRKLTPLKDSEALPLIRQRQKPRLKNFRLSPTDILRLQRLTNAVNEESERPISETAVIKGLIALGERTDPAKLLKFIREVW